MPEAEYLGVFEGEDGEDVDVWATEDGRLYDEDGDELEEVPYLDEQVWELRQEGKPISSRQEVELIDKAEELDLPVRDVYPVVQRHSDDVPEHRQRRLDLAHAMAAADGEVLGDDGRPQQEIDLDEWFDTPERLEDE
jgi:hypothetical protein